jgi:tetratricopeptide (TPR) repeat protein
MRASVATLALAVAAAACAHGPTEADRKRALAQYDAALSLVHEADKAGSESDAQLQDQKYRAALRELVEAEKTGAMTSDAHYLFGLVYFVGFRRHAEAEKQLLLAIDKRQQEREEEYPDAENLLGNVLVDAGRPADALKRFDKARTNLLYATPFFAEQGMGDAYLKLGRQDEAAQHYRRALVAQPDLCTAYTKLAEVELARGDDAALQRVLGEFFERCDSERLRVPGRLLGPAYLQRGKSHLRTKEFELAAADFQVCVERFAGEPAAKECDQQLRALAP